VIRDRVLPLYRSAAAPFAPIRLVAAWRRHEWVAREVDALGPDQLLLDVGCGQGPVARMLAPRHRIVGVDLDLDSLEVFSRYGLAVAADARDLPFADGAFDTALLGQSLNNMIEHDAVFAELARVIRRGGHLVLEHGMLADVSLWPSIAFWWARRRVRSRSEAAYPVTRRPWRHTERSIVSAGFRVVQRIPLEISTGPLASRRLERAQAVVAYGLPKLASQQLVVAVRE
jgi:ubiquinone/menaquinone biosynthesis C-methylase UbiE